MRLKIHVQASNPNKLRLQDEHLLSFHLQEKVSSGVSTVEGGGGGGGEKIAMTASDSSHKSTASAQLKEEADFVMVELVRLRFIFLMNLATP